MRSIVAPLLFVIVASVSMSCTSAELCPRTDRNREWSSACFTGTGPARRVKSEHVKKIIANRAGYATIIIDSPHELVAVDRSGLVRIPNIYHTGDFDFPDANEGLGRFEVITNNDKGERLSKCGYFDGRSFKIIIPATYDQCLAFAQGTAKVCKDCAKICTEPECQNSILVGGQGFSVDSKNRILRQFALPALDKACGDKQTSKMVKVTDITSYLQCGPVANSPFEQIR